MSIAEGLGHRAERAVKNQSVFRDINERIKDLHDGFSARTEVGEWICECAHGTCMEHVLMSSEEYEAVRADGARFFVAPGDQHVWPEVERVTERKARYWIVEKIGDAGELAKQIDPRP
jgi:hypothetical protein